MLSCNTKTCFYSNGKPISSNHIGYQTPLYKIWTCNLSDFSVAKWTLGLVMFVAESVNPNRTIAFILYALVLFLRGDKLNLAVSSLGFNWKFKYRGIKTKGTQGSHFLFSVGDMNSGSCYPHLSPPCLAINGSDFILTEQISIVHLCIVEMKSKPWIFFFFLKLDHVETSHFFFLKGQKIY